MTDRRPQAAVQRAAMDAVAHSPVMVAQREAFQMIEPTPTPGPNIPVARSLEDQPAQGAGMEEELLQGAGLEEELPMQGAGLEEELPLQGAGMEEEELPQLKAAGPDGAAAGAKQNDTGLPDSLKAGVESMSGMSLDDVKVHYGSDKPAQLNALAYAQGTDIHVGAGQEEHLPHEAWHVVQQAQGRVQPTRQMKEGTPVNDDRSLESEADVMGAKAMAAGQQLANEAEV